MVCSVEHDDNSTFGNLVKPLRVHGREPAVLRSLSSCYCTIDVKADVVVPVSFSLMEGPCYTTKDKTEDRQLA
jgi:hypothetical protein